MEFTLEDVGPEYRKKQPSVLLHMTDGDSPESVVLSVDIEGIDLVGGMQLLVAAVNMVEEEMTDDQKEEFSEWLAGDGD